MDRAEALDLCLSCKGCKSECPANVDMARMKAEFLQGRFDRQGTPLSARLFGNYARLSRLAAFAPWLANFFMTFFLTRWIMGRLMKLAPQRQLPRFASRTFTRQFKDYRRRHAGPEGDRQRYAISVIMEYGGSGGKVAGPIANQIVRALIDEGYLSP